MSLDKAVIKKSEEAILGILGGIGDLSHEIANTVCNIFYNYCKLYPKEEVEDIPVEDIKERLGFLDDILFEDADNPFSIVRLNIDTLEDSRKKGSYQSFMTAEFVCLNKLIRCLRIFTDLEYVKNDLTYYYLLDELIIDIFKYKIARAFDKTPVRRKIERKIKKNKINEIQNLVDFMEVRIDDDDLYDDDDEYK